RARRVSSALGARRVSSALGARHASADLLEDGQEIRAEPRGVLAHREVAEAFHHGHARALDGGRRAPRVIRGAREVVLAGEENERAPARVDRVDLSTQVALGAIEVEVAAKDAGPALRVAPERLPARLGRTLG